MSEMYKFFPAQKSAFVLALTVTAIVALSCSSDDSSHARGSEVGASPSSSDTAVPGSDLPQDLANVSSDCSQLAITPTYLPWLDPAAPVPPAAEGAGPAEGSYVASWHAPEGGGPDSLFYVSLSVSTQIGQGAGPGKPTGVLLQGDEGEVYGTGLPTDVYISWELERAACNLISLSLVAPETWDGQRTESELIRVAESLVVSG